MSSAVIRSAPHVRSDQYVEAAMLEERVCECECMGVCVCECASSAKSGRWCEVNFLAEGAVGHFGGQA